MPRKIRKGKDSSRFALRARRPAASVGGALPAAPPPPATQTAPGPGSEVVLHCLTKPNAVAKNSSLQRHRLRRVRIRSESPIGLNRRGCSDWSDCARHRLGLYFHLLAHNQNVHAEDIVEFLRNLRRQIQRPLAVVWDRINIHDKPLVGRNNLARNPSIRTHRLPAYAPELNPDEGVWSYTKFARLANFAPTDVHELRHAVESELEDLRDRKELLASFIRHSGLPLRGGAIH